MRQSRRHRDIGLLTAALLLLRCAPLLASNDKPLIQISVEVVEVDEHKTENLGVSWLNSLHVNEVTVPALFEVGTFTRAQLFADLQFMLEHGSADLLANPKLVTRDGTVATFHAGGELPYASAGSQGTVNVEFKSYGVDLKINPHLESGRISLSVDAEVSSPDQQNSVSLSGNVVPGIRSRRVNSHLMLSPGSTLTMAGLIQSEKESTRSGVPGLMSIPGLGALFSHRVETQRRTSIVVFITPTILDGQEPATPAAALSLPRVTSISTEQPPSEEKAREIELKGPEENTTDERI